MKYLKDHKNLIWILILLIPIGLGTKLYKGDYYFWINNSFSDILYEIFWSVLLFLLVPKFKIIHNVIVIFIVTAIIEFLQLVKTPFLQELRSTFLGKTLLGTTFIWMDFFYYGLGCLISYFILKWHVSRIIKQRSQL